MPDPPEITFQRHIADFLVREHGYVALTQADITDRAYHCAENHLWDFLRETQPDTVARLESDYATDARDEVFRELRAEVDRRPLWTLLRSGLSVRGHEFKLCFPPPRSEQSAARDLYAKNRIAFRPNYHFGPGGHEIDFVFFLNGLPIVTLEVKHEANQNVFDAVKQYANRDHADRLFQLPFLHFAADTADVQAATDPSDEGNFLWFNTGLTNQAQTDGEYPVEFLYREVLGRESLLRAVAFDLVYAPKQAATLDRPERVARTLFPRYHQRRCVEKIADETQRHFADTGDVGRKFLINHSAGSGKTLTMCWLADRLHSLYKPGTTEKMVNTVFLITDRKSLDKNIRDDLEKFAHLRDVTRFAKRSGDLGRFLRDREQIIVTTQQKFSAILDRLSEDNGLKDLRVAFLIDEAHRSQEGRMATAIRTPFREDTAAIPDADTHDADEDEDPQDQIARAIRRHDLNQLFVAFTATPSAATVKLFGKPFDTYHEAEAIHEGYIVDVAQSIVSYKTLYHLDCPVIPLAEQETLYPPGVVAKALKNVAFQDDELIQYKAEVMLRLFEERVKHRIGGRAKAMIVATSRVAGLAYFNVIRQKLKERGADYKALFAFSDFVHPVTEQPHTEAAENGLIDGELIEDRFE
ncbi:MAG: DEAD/DEAH box helicase family protein, partial [Planctomycetota bacterium]